MRRQQRIYQHADEDSPYFTAHSDNLGVVEFVIPSEHRSIWFSLAAAEDLSLNLEMNARMGRAMASDDRLLERAREAGL